MSFEPREYLRHILLEADYLVGRRHRTVPAGLPPVSPSEKAASGLRPRET